MAINLEEHKFFEFQRKMDVVPYSIAVKAVEEAVEQAIGAKTEIDKAMNMIVKSMEEVNKTVGKIDD